MTGEDHGLVLSYLLEGKGGGWSINWEEFRQWSPEQGCLWVHLNYTSDRVQKWLREESALSPMSCESLLEEEIRPRVVSSSDGLLLRLRGANCNPGADPEDMVSLRMLFDENPIITMRHRRVMAVDDIHSGNLSAFRASCRTSGD